MQYYNWRQILGYFIGAGVCVVLIPWLDFYEQWPLFRDGQAVVEVIAVIIAILYMFKGMAHALSDTTQEINVGAQYKSQVGEKRHIVCDQCLREVYIHTYCFNCYPDTGLLPNTGTAKETREYEQI